MPRDVSRWRKAEKTARLELRDLGGRLSPFGRRRFQTRAAREES
jgi:hypothetical protein